MHRQSTCIAPLPPEEPNAALIAMMTNMLNTAEPTMVPTPTSLSTDTPARDVKSSGADDPAAMNVAPATSSESLSAAEISSSTGTK